MVVPHISLNVDSGIIEFVSPQLLDSLDLMLEALILFLTEHVLVFVVEIFFPVSTIDSEDVAIQSKRIGIC